MLLMTLSLSACAGAGPADSFCAVSRPILLDPGDVLTRDSLRAIVGHNERGANLCGWSGKK